MDVALEIREIGDPYLTKSEIDEEVPLIDITTNKASYTFFLGFETILFPYSIWYWIWAAENKVVDKEKQDEWLSLYS